MSVFEYVPDRGFSKQTTPRVLVTQFGDGYAHRVVDGINSINTVWDLTFTNRTLVDAAAMIAFFEAAAGATSFQWTPPDELVEYSVIANDWRLVYESHISRTISVKFTRVY